MNLTFKCVMVSMLAMVSMTGWAQQVVKVTNGTDVNTQFELADKPYVSYTPQGLEIVAGTVTVTYPADGTYTFEIIDASGISDTFTRANISRNGDHISISNLKAGETVAVYNISGQLIQHTVADNGGNAIVDLSAYRGVAVITMANQSFKIVR